MKLLSKPIHLTINTQTWLSNYLKAVGDNKNTERSCLLAQAIFHVCLLRLMGLFNFYNIFLIHSC